MVIFTERQRTKSNHRNCEPSDWETLDVGERERQTTVFDLVVTVLRTESAEFDRQIFSAAYEITSSRNPKQQLLYTITATTS